MAKVIMTIAPEDGMCFEEIFSFETDNYIGIFNSVTEEFMLISKSSQHFEPFNLDSKHYDNLRELDDDVFELCDEHITDVYGHSNYTIELL